MSCFHIRPYRSEDAEEIYAAANESREHVGHWMGWLTPAYSRKAADDWVARAMASWESGGDCEHVIVDASDGGLVGCCGLNRLNRMDLVCNLSYWVRSSRVGEGAARQAVLLLRDFGFRTLNFNRLEIVVADGNTASRRVAEGVGATYEGLQRKRLKVGPLVYDAHMYALVNGGAGANRP